MTHSHSHTHAQPSSLGSPPPTHTAARRTTLPHPHRTSEELQRQGRGGGDCEGAGPLNVHRKVGSVPHEVRVADVVLDETTTQDEHPWVTNAHIHSSTYTRDTHIHAQTHMHTIHGAHTNIHAHRHTHTCTHKHTRGTRTHRHKKPEPLWRPQGCDSSSRNGSAVPTQPPTNHPLHRHPGPHRHLRPSQSKPTTHPPVFLAASAMSFRARMSPTMSNTNPPRL